LLVDLDFDVALTGFDVPEIDLIVAEFSPDNQDDEDDEEQCRPERSAGQAVTRAGDLYHLGDHRLLCGNSLFGDDFQRLMQVENASVCFTDAPYNVPIGGHVSGLGKTRHREFAVHGGWGSGLSLPRSLAPGWLAMRSESRYCVWHAQLPQFARSISRLPVRSLAVIFAN
jgi:hypothetical protein